MGKQAGEEGARAVIGRRRSAGRCRSGRRSTRNEPSRATQRRQTAASEGRGGDSCRPSRSRKRVRRVVRESGSGRTWATRPTPPADCASTTAFWPEATRRSLAGRGGCFCSCEASWRSTPRCLSRLRGRSRTHTGNATCLARARAASVQCEKWCASPDGRAARAPAAPRTVRGRTSRSKWCSRAPSAARVKGALWRRTRSCGL